MSSKTERAKDDGPALVLIESQLLAIASDGVEDPTQDDTYTEVARQERSAARILE